MRCFFRVFFALVLSAATVAGRADDNKDKDKPAPLPVTAKLIANSATYQLNLGDKTPEQFRDALKEAEKTGRYPNPPTVDLTLELTNTSDKEVTIWSSGDPVQVVLELKGKGAVSVKPMRISTREFRVPQPLTLAAGKSHTIAVKRLIYGARGVGEQAYWTEAGEYTLTARFVTGIAPPPPDSKDVEDGFAKVTLGSKPVKIKVESK